MKMPRKELDKIFLGGLLSKNTKIVNNLSKESIAELLNMDLYDILYFANKVREKYCGNKIKFCSIINAKSGRCSEDCKFCAQSNHYSSGHVTLPEYDLMDPYEILSAAKEAEKSGSKRFGIVTSGLKINNDDELSEIIKTVKLLKRNTSLSIDGSLGCIDIQYAKLLKKAGLKRYHHNLETSQKFFPKVCTTHNFSQKLGTINAVKKAGLELCCGALFGLGETWDDRIELAFLLKEINPDAIPLNFLCPIEGTPFGNNNLLNPREILRIIAIFRIILFNKDISICGGREFNLRNLQSWMFYAGANCTMLGNYLTTKGTTPEEDIRMVMDLGLNPEI